MSKKRPSLSIITTANKNFPYSDNTIPISSAVSEIYPWLFIGTISDANNLEILNENGFKSIISCCHEIPINLSPNISYHHHPVTDHPDTPLIDTIILINDILEYNFNNNIKTLIHCKMGISRSPSFVIGYLILKRNMSFDDAHSFIVEKRNCVEINLGFYKELENLSNPNHSP